jgi:hypothetical protein
MVHTFGTWEEAALYSSFMRSEGYFTAVFDECSASLYGPPAVGGIRVFVSDEPLAEVADDMTYTITEHEIHPSSLNGEGVMDAIRLATISLVAFGLLVLAYILMQSAHYVPGGLLGILLSLLAYPALLGFLFLSLVPGLGPLTRCVRESRENGCTGWLFWFVMLLLFSKILFL